MKKIAVYGSLRKNEYNFNRFKNVYKDDFNFIKTTIVKGYNLFSLGSYPGINKGSNDLVVDVIECNDECFKNINNMEVGANYTPVKTVVDDIECTIYIYNKTINDVIEHGDWSKYLTEKKYDKING